MTLTLVEDHKISGKWNPMASFSHIVLNWLGWNTPSMHHPQRRNVNTSMVGLKNCHVCKNLTQNRAWNSTRKRGFLWKWKSKIAGENFSAEKQIDKHAFFKTARQCCRKCGNHDVNKCELVASKIERWWSYRSWTFAYFKLFPWRKYTADSDWSKNLLNQWTLTLHSSLTEVSRLHMWRVCKQSVQLQVTARNRGRGGRMQETKETNSDQTSTVQEMTCRHQRKQHTWCTAFKEIFLRSFIQNDFSASRQDLSRRKQNKGVWVSFIQKDCSRRKQTRGARMS